MRGKHQELLSIAAVVSCATQSAHALDPKFLPIAPPPVGLVFTGSANAGESGDNKTFNVPGVTANPEPKFISIDGSTSGGLVEGAVSLQGEITDSALAGEASSTLAFSGAWTASQPNGNSGWISASVVSVGYLKIELDEEVTFAISFATDGPLESSPINVSADTGEIIGNRMMPGTYKVGVQWVTTLSEDETAVSENISWTLTMTALPRGVVFVDENHQFTGTASWPPGKGYEGGEAGATSSSTFGQKLVSVKGSTSGGLVDIQGEVDITAAIEDPESLVEQTIVTFDLLAEGSQGENVNGSFSVIFDVELLLLLDQEMVFAIEETGVGFGGIVFEPDGPNGGQIVGDHLLPGVYRIYLHSTVDMSSDETEVYGDLNWTLTLIALPGPNSPPECPDDVTVNLWPPNHQYHEIDLNAIAGAIDPDKDAITYTILSITQDEPSNSNGDGDTTCDGVGAGSDVALIRAERQGNGDGRVYHINYIADDGNGGTCEGVVTVTVPKSQSQPAVDSGQTYMSRDCFSAADIDANNLVNSDDLLWVINTWGDTGPDETLNWPDADTNIDGIVDVYDLITIINNWGPS